MQWNVNLPSYSGDYQSAWQGSQHAQQGQINSGAAMWQQLIAQQQASAAANNAHWQALLGQTVGGLRGANKANLQDIADKYTALSGQMSQQAIDRGLGNTTVQSSLQRGVAADQAKESTRSRNQFAQTVAGYQASLGGQGLQAEQQNNAYLGGLGKGQIDWLTGINIGYPDRNSFNQQSAYGGGGGGVFYPPVNQPHHFAGEGMPMTYEGGYGGGGGYGGAGGYAAGNGIAYSPEIAPMAQTQQAYTPIGIGAMAYNPYPGSYGGGGGDF